MVIYRLNVTTINFYLFLNNWNASFGIIMKQLVFIFLFFGLTSCKNDNIPDVSNIKVNVTVERFEQDFFKIDTLKTEQQIDALQTKYPNFTIDYLYNILGATPQKDSTIKLVNLFINDNVYKQVFNDAQDQYKNFSKHEKEIIESFKFIKHYFPSYNLPSKVITFIGPIDGVGTALTSNHDIAIGLQSFLGANYPLYQTAYVQEIYPSYIAKRFEPNYLAVNVVKNIVEDLFPYTSNGRPLIEQMVEKGKRLYLINAFMPNVADSLKIGYTANQLSECNNNEAFIFSYFVQNNLLFQTEPSIIMPYITDGPKTQELSQTAPGNIGSFVGLKIVQNWMKKNKGKTLEQLMKTPATAIFNEANYKP
jgi:hypothetical protein